MIAISEIDWGPTDAAEHDKRFTEKFVEPIQIRQLLHERYRIVTGEKGSGKTALRQALLQKYSSNYSGVVDLDFDSLEYTSIVLNLNQLSQVTNIPRLSILTNYWKYVLLVQCMKDYVSRFKDPTSANYGLLHNYLSKNQLIEASHLRLFLSLISKCWTFIDSYTHPSQHDGAKDLPFLPSNLAPEVIEQVRQYPMFNPEFMRICGIFESLLRDKKSKYLIILDGFDRFENREAVRSDVNLIFESLVEAVYSLSISESWHDIIAIKALIPHDRYLSINLRDSDKFGEKQKSIKWTFSGLQELLVRRARLHPKLSHLTVFDKLWQEIMPESVENTFYRIEEGSYQYLLRHTMYRPRQLQIHLKILSELFEDEIIEPKMIPKAIRQSCRKIAEYYIKEYNIDHPNLDKFIARFHEKMNVMPYQEFRKIVANALKHFSIQGWTVEAKIDALYEMGFFGVIQNIEEYHPTTDDEFNYLPPRKPGIKPYRVMFYYKNHRSRIINKLRDADLVAIHPIFFGYADMKPHPDFIVG
jgi:hypothetical protein